MFRWSSLIKRSSNFSTQKFLKTNLSWSAFNRKVLPNPHHSKFFTFSHSFWFSTKSHSAPEHGTSSIPDSGADSVMAEYQYLLAKYTVAKQNGSVSKEDISHMLNALCKMGVSHAEQSNFSEATKYYLEVIALAQEAGITDAVELAYAHSGMGAVFLKEKALDKAQEHLEKATEIYAKAVETGPKKTRSQAIENECMLAMLYLEQDKLDQATEYFEKVLNKLSELPKQETALFHIKVCDGLGEIFMKKLDSAQALEFWEKAISLVKENYGEENIELNNFYKKIIDAYTDQQDMDKAMEYAQKSLKICREHYGEDHLEVGLALYRLGGVYLRTREYDKGVEKYEEAIRVLEKKIESYGELLSQACFSLARIYLSLERKEKSKEYFDKTYSVLVKNYGEESLQLAEFYNSWGEFIANKKNTLGESKEYFQKALKIYTKHGGPNDPNVIMINIILGEITFYEGDVEQALKYVNEALNLSLATESRPKAIEEIYNLLGSMNFHAGRHKDSIEHFQKAIGSAIVSGDEAANLHYYYQGLGAALESLDSIEEAIDAYKKGLELSQRVEDSEGIQHIAHSLGHALNKAGKHEEAQAINEKYHVSCGHHH